MTFTFEENMNWTNGDFTISTDKSRLDLDVIHGFLQTSYWGAERTRREIEKTIENSICFGLFYKERQIGFARLVTDEVVISWLGDVFVIPDFQNKGLGKWLMECVTSHPITKRTKCLLGTKDAHGLYEKYGWNRKEMMSRPEEEKEDSNQSAHTTPASAPR
ncbi:acetyltransferase, GNAT family [Verrucomicrobiia bacterium DG1235]|nr:acetyltransferase, GNAT family [Verrucomicrobiae bacterium DG1235]